jgi:hypothetical protein
VPLQRTMGTAAARCFRSGSSTIDHSDPPACRRRNGDACLAKLIVDLTSGRWNPLQMPLPPLGLVCFILAIIEVYKNIAELFWVTSKTRTGLPVCLITEVH